MKWILLVVIGLFVLAQTPEMAFAESCTDLSNTCLRNGMKPGKCSAALQKCLAVCKAGKPATFVGPGSGKAFPVSECR